jgi:hypothetical protein
VPTAPVNNGAKIGLIIGAVVALVAIGSIGMGIMRARAAERRARALRDLSYSLSTARNSYSYGSNTYGSNTNTSGSNAYGSTGRNYAPTGSTYGVPAFPSFVINSANRSMSDISTQLLSRSASFRGCAMADPSARSQMAVRFMIGSQGNVLTSFASAGASSGSTAVDQCVNAIVRTMYFPRSSSGVSIVVHPIQLR